MEFWASSVPRYREAIWRAIAFHGTPDYEEDEDIFIDLPNFCVFGFGDCIPIKTCCPGAGPVNSEGGCCENAFEIQRAFYTRYGKQWGMKAQTITLPNGMVGHAYISSIAQNDRGMVNISGIEEMMKVVL